MQRKKSFSLSILAFYTRTPTPPTSTFFFPLFQLWKVSPSTSKTSSINTPHNHEVCYSFHIYSLASPPRIHMDSWWAASNPNQGLKWTKILPKTDLELMGPSHVGFRLQNHQNRCSIQAGPINRLNWFPTG